MAHDEQMNTKSRRRSGFPLPVAHLMGLAPLDVWLGLLGRSGMPHPKYWLRLGFALFTSFVGTVCTVHERIAIALWARSRRGRAAIERHKPSVVVILGYYRSGTTHLQNLMASDQRFVTPRWHQCLAGQGFWIGWTVVRFMLVPFLGRTRPQDAVGFGPDWPGEDDFALCSWGLCSPIPGRLIYPSRWDQWKRWHDLEQLTDADRDRWRRLTRLFVWKLTRGPNRGRTVLLKTPSHSARVAELDRLFDGRVRFVHLVREPRAVIDSNVRMHRALKAHLLEDPLSVQAIRERIVDDYAATEDKCERELATIDPSRVARIRYQDLRADGVGTLRGVHETLGMGWTSETEAATTRYLGTLGDYRPARTPMDLGEPTAREDKVCAAMAARHRLDEPAVESRLVELIEPPTARIRRAALAAVGIMVLCWWFWLGTVWVQHEVASMRPRMIMLVWPLGAAIGWGTRVVARRGSRGLGIWCVALTLLMTPTVLFAISVVNWNWAADDGTRAWLYHNSRNVYQGLQGSSSIVLVILACVTAYRHASADGPQPPGR